MERESDDNLTREELLELLKDARGRISALEESATRLAEMSHDITELKQTEEALRESEDRFRRLVELSPYGIGIAYRGLAVFVNSALIRMLKAGTAEDIIGKPIFGFVHPDLRASAEEHIRQVVMKGEAVQFAQQKLITLDGDVIDVEVTAIPFRYKNEPSVQAVFNDVTARNRAEMDLKASLREKEVLLREIHHRVKNNFAVIASLLNMQSRYASSELVRMSFQDALARIKSMALAHRFLYMSPSLSELSARKYLTDLVGHVAQSSYALGVSMRVKTEIEDITIGPDTAIPLGFILAELMTNCAKHAFPQGENGEVSISLRSTGDRQAQLMVADNGVGIPEDVDLGNPKSLGLDLVATFVNQMQGEIEIRRDKGTDVRIRFTPFQNQET